MENRLLNELTVSEFKNILTEIIKSQSNRNKSGWDQELMTLVQHSFKSNNIGTPARLVYEFIHNKFPEKNYSKQLIGRCLKAFGYKVKPYRDGDFIYNLYLLELPKI